MYLIASARLEENKCRRLANVEDVAVTGGQGGAEHSVAGDRGSQACHLAVLREGDMNMVHRLKLRKCLLAVIKKIMLLQLSTVPKV